MSTTFKTWVTTCSISTTYAKGICIVVKLELFVDHLEPSQQTTSSVIILQKFKPYCKHFSIKFMSTWRGKKKVILTSNSELKIMHYACFSHTTAVTSRCFTGSHSSICTLICLGNILHVGDYIYLWFVRLIVFFFLLLGSILFPFKLTKKLSLTCMVQNEACVSYLHYEQYNIKGGDNTSFVPKILHSRTTHNAAHPALSLNIKKKL